MHSSERTFNITNLIKVIYFSLIFLIILASFFNYLFLLLLLVHAFPMFVNGLIIFSKVRTNKLRFNAFYSPLVTYLINFPYAIGFYLGLIVPYKK